MSPAPPPVTSAMFPGILGELVELSCCATESSAACVGIHLLVGLGSLIGPGPHVRVGATRHGVNLFALVVGPTATGRKGRRKNVALLPLQALGDPDWQVASGLSSGEGVIFHVRDPQYGIDKKSGERIVVDAGAEDKRLFIVQTEFSQPLEKTQRRGEHPEQRAAGRLGRRLVLRTLTRTAPLVATAAHVSLIGHTTREDLRAHLGDLSIADGFGNRFMYVATQRVRDLPDPDELTEDVLHPIVDELRRVVAFAQGAGRLPRTPEAAATWRVAYRELARGEPGLAGALLAGALVTSCGSLPCLRSCVVRPPSTSQTSTRRWPGGPTVAPACTCCSPIARATPPSIGSRPSWWSASRST